MCVEMTYQWVVVEEVEEDVVEGVQLVQTIQAIVHHQDPTQQQTLVP